MGRLGILFMIVLGFNCSHEPSTEYDLMISNVNLIDGTGNRLQEGVSIAITDGKIQVES